VVFDNTTLTDVVAEFNRYNTRKMVIADPSIAAVRIGGNFRSTNTDGFLWLLQSGFPITVEERDDKVVLRAR
jgi:transmembrane sensor